MMHYNDFLREYFTSTMDSGGEAPDNDFRPFYAIDYNKPETLSKALLDTLQILLKENDSRAQNMLRNISFYNGIHTLQNNTDSRAEDYDKQPISMENRFVMNHILDFTIQKQARLMRFSPNINVFPWNNQYADKLGARLGKKVINSAFYVHNIDDVLAEMTLEASVCGESFLFVEWDEFAGDVDPVVAKAQARQQAKIAGKFMTEDGQEINLNQIKTIGDHKLDHPLPFHVVHEPRIRWRDVNYIFKGTPKHIDQVRAENANLGEQALAKIKLNAGQGVKDTPGTEYGHWVIEWEFYHRKHRFLPNGLYAKFIGPTVLVSGDLPYTHGELPVCRFTDYDQPLTAHGRSFYEDLKLPSVMINNMMKVAYRSFCIAAYPKLIMPRDSCNMYSLANGPFVVEYTPGMEAPKIVSFNAVNQDFFPLSEHVEGFMEKMSGTFASSRGGTIPNARATGMLTFYEEQEEQRESSQIRKYTALIAKIGRHLLANSGDYYKPEDGRTLRIIGKNNQYKLLKVTDTTKLSSKYSVEVQRTTALSESKQGRVDQISALSNIPLAGDAEPGLFTREQILQMIEVADTPTFFEMATAAVERANSENEDLFEGLPVEEPKEYQAHLIDWNVHYQFMQSREFSDTQGIPGPIRDAFLDHFRTHEFFMYEKAKFNIKFCEVLMQNKYFPAVFKLQPAALPLSQIMILLQSPPMPQALPPPAEAGPGAGAGEEIPPGAEEEGAPDEMVEGDEVPPDDMPEEGEDFQEETGAVEAPRPKKKRITMTGNGGEQKVLDIEELDG